VNLAGLKMCTPVTTASGTFGFRPGIRQLSGFASSWCAVTVKGTTLLPRAGNKGQRAVETPSGMLNCVGLGESRRRVFPTGDFAEAGKI
jgi:dihydroorotate dehydrogenase (NAD+) catalytic subunit